MGLAGFFVPVARTRALRLRGVQRFDHRPRIASCNTKQGRYYPGMPDTVTIQTIIGSTRPNRFSEKPARWIHDQIGARAGVHAELLDLRDYALPFFDGLVSPARFQGTYPHPVAEAWARKVNEADAYVIVAPEYNHGYSAVLKNGLDWAFREWN